MIDKEITLDKLNTFIQKDKFSTSAWEERGLNPSDSELCNRLQNFFNGCSESLIEATNSNYTSKQLIKILKNWLESLNRSQYDTEEKEFICDYFHELSTIVSVEFKNDLNSWLYGKVLNSLFMLSSFFKGKEKILETLSQDCTKCNSKLETFILRRGDNIPDHTWKIVRCNNCNEFNLVSPGPNIKEYRFGNYKPIEDLLKSDFTEEQAIIRIEQIKYFRR